MLQEKLEQVVAAGEWGAADLWSAIRAGALTQREVVLQRICVCYCIGQAWAFDDNSTPVLSGVLDLYAVVGIVRER